MSSSNSFSLRPLIFLKGQSSKDNTHSLVKSARKWSALTLLLLLNSAQIFSQLSEVVINEVLIDGNFKTKDFVIKNEMTLKTGDTISIEESENILAENRAFILSTGLFNNAKLFLINWKGNHADLMIEVEENWYIFPAPIFELADRNFNVWWQEQGRALDRINYGLRLAHYNTSGAKDPIKFKFQFGYTRKFEVDYIYPYLNKARTLGLGATVFYSDNKEIGYITLGNKTQFRKAEDERVLLRRFRIGPRLAYRPQRKLFHAFRLEFHRNSVDPFVRDSLNENYFLNDRTSIKFFYAEYDIQYDERDYSLLPNQGYLAFGNIKKEGFGIFNEFNNLSISAGLENYTKLGKGFVLANRIKGKTNITRQQISFANNTGLGWSEEDAVTGYELYVMDGTDFFISTNSLRTKLIEYDLSAPRWLPRQFEKINFQFFLRFNYDFAYVNERDYTDTNTLNNKWFSGYGPAIDMILFNNFLFSFEYSFNDLGEQGFFIHSKNAF